MHANITVNPLLFALLISICPFTKIFTFACDLMINSDNKIKDLIISCQQDSAEFIENGKSKKEKNDRVKS